MVVAFRHHTYCRWTTVRLTRSTLHRSLQRHGISRLPDIGGDKPKRQRFKRYPIGFFHIDIAELQTADQPRNRNTAWSRQMRAHLADFMAAYNVARRLKTLNCLTPNEYIAKIWTS